MQTLWYFACIDRCQPRPEKAQSAQTFTSKTKLEVPTFDVHDNCLNNEQRNSWDTLCIRYSKFIATLVGIVFAGFWCQNQKKLQIYFFIIICNHSVLLCTTSQSWPQIIFLFVVFSHFAIFLFISLITSRH